MKRGGLGALAILAAISLVTAEEWTVIPQNGRDYVSFANVARFYQFNDYSYAVNAVSLRSGRRSIRARDNTSEISINGVRFFTHFPIRGASGETLISALDVAAIIEPILRPSRIGTNRIETVVLDPGHGGDDQGAESRYGNEKQHALDVALAARDQLQQAGFKVVMTRDRDVAVSLDERLAIANAAQNAVFVSIHFNTASGGTGAESYALAPAGVASKAAPEENSSGVNAIAYSGNSHDPANLALAAAVHAAVLSRVPVYDRGVRHARFRVLRDVRIPAVLLEAGFLNDVEEGARIATSQHRHQLGWAIAQAVQNFNAAVTFQGGPTLAAAATYMPPHSEPITAPLRNDLTETDFQKPSISIDAGK